MNLSRWDCKRDCGRREGALIAGLVSGLVSHTGGLFSGAELDTKRSSEVWTFLLCSTAGGIKLHKDLGLLSSTRTSWSLISSWSGFCGTLPYLQNG